MNAPRRTVALLFVLIVATPVASLATGGVASSPVTTTNAATAFQQGTENGSNVTTAVSNASATPSNVSANNSNTSANASITVGNQTRSGQSVYVDSATLPEGGFVVLEERGPNGNVVGVSLYLDPGTHEGKVTLRGVPGARMHKTSLGANTTLLASVHRDTDGNERFDALRAPDTDGPYTENGTPVNDSARIVVPEEERPTTAAVNVTNQTTNGTAVTVDSVTLPDGGYVGVHRGGYNGSNATQNMVGASEYLGPGTYENVTVRVSGGATGSASTLTDSTRVSAVVYEDTDGDRAFQYVPSGGIEDQPYLADGTPVAESAFFTVDRPPTPTAQTTETSAPTPTTDKPPTPAARDRTTAYGGESNAREGILENPLFPLLVFVFAIFAVLVAVGGR